MLEEFIYPLLLPTALFLFSVSLWRYYIDSLRDSSVSLPLPPGTVGLPFVGETLSMAFQGWKFYQTRREKYGHVYKTHVLGKPTIRVWGTDNIRKILKNEEMLHTMCWPTSVIEILGKGALVASTRRTHTFRRAMVCRAFTNKAIQEYSKVTEKLLTDWLRSLCESQDVMRSINDTRKLSFRVSAKILLGAQYSEEQMNRLTTNFEIMQQNFFSLPVNIPGTSFHQAMSARTKVLTVIRDIIKQKRTTPVTDEEEGTADILTILLQNIEEGHITQSEVEDQLIESVFSFQQGYPSLFCSILTLLAKHPHVIDKLLQELSNADLLGQPTTGKTNMTANVLKDLPYLDMLWKEITRISPPFGGGFRKVIKTFELEGYQIPEGWTILYSIRDNHQAEENYQSASEFNPDRWAEPDDVTESWMPFGGQGIRSCIAQNFNKMFFKQFIALLVKNCEWEIHQTQPQFSQFPLLIPKTELPIVFYPRKLPTFPA